MLLGARQTGKTTLARMIAKQRPSIYLDLESPRDLAKLADPVKVKFLKENSDKLIIIDEIQHAPDLFMALRGVIDENRAAGKEGEQFLLIGSASMGLLRQPSQNLAGRISYVDMSGLNAMETGEENTQPLWLRGGFPGSYLAKNDTIAMRRLENIVRAYLERDVPQMGFNVPAARLRRLWTMLAHLQGENVNYSQIANNLEVDRKTIDRYINILTHLFLVRSIEPLHVDIKKRLIKSPRYYVRDSGILHRLLNIENHNALLSNHILGKSWEGFVIENIHSVLSILSQTYFYCTSSGAEIDLVIRMPNAEIWAVGIKYGVAPKLNKHYSRTCDDIGATQKYIVYGGNDEFPVQDGVRVISLERMMKKLISCRA